MFCTYCGNTINEGAKFCQYCGKKTVLAAKGSLTEDTIPNYPGEEYTIVYSKNGQGESRVEKVSDRRAYQPGERTVDEQDRGGYYASQARSAYGGRTGGHAQDTGRMSSCAQEAGAMSGYALMAFPKARKDGMLRAEADNSAGSVKMVMFLEMLAASAAVLALNPVTGGAVLAAAYLTLLLYHHVAMKEFGGVSGDLAGWFLSLCELLMLGAAVTAGMIIG